MSLFEEKFQEYALNGKLSLALFSETLNNHRKGLSENILWSVFLHSSNLTKDEILWWIDVINVNFSEARSLIMLLLRKVKFEEFSLEDRLELAHKVLFPEAWQFLLDAKVISAWQLYQSIKDAEDLEGLFILLFGTEEIPFSEMFKQAKSNNSVAMWQAVLSSKQLSVRQMFQAARKACELNRRSGEEFWPMVIYSKKLSKKQLLNVGKNIYRDWELIINQIGLENLTANELEAICDEYTGEYQFYRQLIDVGTISPRKLIDILAHSSNYDSGRERLGEYAIKSPKYEGKFNSSLQMELGRRLGCWEEVANALSKLKK